MSGQIRAGELWESIEHPSREERHGPPAGLCVVVGANTSLESPDSYVMMRLTAGQRPWEHVGQLLYMHRRPRLAGQWIRRGVLARLAPAPEVAS